MTADELAPGLFDLAMLRVVSQTQHIPLERLLKIYMQHTELMADTAEQVVRFELAKWSVR